MWLSTAEAAGRLGVSDRQVRRLVQRGALPATWIGGRLVLDSADVDRRVVRAPERGRPFAPRTSWAALWMVSGERVSWLQSSEGSRLRRWLRHATPETLALATRERARVERYRVLPRYLDELAGAIGVIRGGVSAADDVGADIVSVGAAELYCAEQTRLLLVADYGLTESREPNVIIRVPLLEFSLLDHGHATMPAGVIAMDLLEADDVRTRRAGHQIVDQLLRSMP